MNNIWSILISYFNFELLYLLAQAAIKTTFLLAFVALICLVFRRFSAATRHLLWTFVLCGSLVLPFLSFMTIWEVSVLPESFSMQSTIETNKEAKKDSLFEKTELHIQSELTSLSTVSDNLQKDSQIQLNEAVLEKNFPLQTTTEISTQQENAESWLPKFAGLLLVIWFTGFLLLLSKLLTAFIATNLLKRQATRFENAALNELFSSILTELNLNHSVRLLRSERISMPIVCGVIKPAVLLPVNADEWSEERQRMVLLHELTHVARRDCLTQMLAQIACAVYWFNPLVWFAARRLRIEREHACDDYVLSIGTKPSDYAHHLLEIARSMRDCSVIEWSRPASVAVARRSQLEGRLRAILNKENKHAAVSKFASSALLALISLLLLSLGVIRPAVIKARNPQAKAIVKDGETADAQTSLVNSIWTIGSEPENNTVSHYAETKGEISKKENTATAENPDESDLNNRQIVQNVESVIKPDISDNAITVETMPQVTGDVQPRGPSQAAMQLDDAAFSQVNAKYQKENRNEQQDKSPDYIDEMASVGYTNLTVNQLVRLKNGGVTADYVKNLRALGFSNLNVEELAHMGIHRVSPAYIQAIRAAGYNDLSLRDLTSFRIHGVTPEFISAMRNAGFNNLTARQLTEFAVHNVTTKFISEIRAAGFSNLSPREFVSLRIYGITPNFIRKAKSRLGELTVRQLITLKNSGAIGDENDKDKERDEDQE
ncbi:MAG: M56 family metallopeptidase [Acidobacteriota bacterium]|nr:M56 family metallopeptidase [Acidobacteriota bacterium]